MRGAGDIATTSKMASGIILLHHSKLGPLGIRRSRLLGEASATVNYHPTTQVKGQDCQSYVARSMGCSMVCLLEGLMAAERGSSCRNARGEVHCQLLPSMLCLQVPGLIMQISKQRLLAADSVHASSLRTLGLQTSRGLTSASLRDAFRACALAWHPDRHAGPEKHVAEAKFKEAQSAYTLLKSLCV